MYALKVMNRNRGVRLALMTFALAATLGAPSFAQDPGPIEQSSIALIETVLGIPQMTYLQRSYSAPRNPGQPAPHAIYATADWQTACEFRLDGTTTESPSGADLSGTLTIGVQGRQPPCPDGIFSRIVGTTTECVNNRVVWVNTLEWYCPPDYHVETSVERVVSDTPC